MRTWWVGVVLAGCDGGDTGSTDTGTDSGDTSDTSDTGQDTSDTSDTSDTGDTGVPDGIHGAFHLEGTPSAGDYRWTEDDGNLVFCEYYPTFDDYVWVRLARDTTARGENGPHIDIDVCNWAGAGTFLPHDGMAGSCGAGPTWDIWWHEGGDAWVNGADADPCTLVLAVEPGDVLTGTFECQPLEPRPGASGNVAVTDGTFRCIVQTT